MSKSGGWCPLPGAGKWRECDACFECSSHGLLCPKGQKVVKTTSCIALEFSYRGMYRFSMGFLLLDCSNFWRNWQSEEFSHRVLLIRGIRVCLLMCPQMYIVRMPRDRFSWPAWQNEACTGCTWIHLAAVRQPGTNVQHHQVRSVTLRNSTL